MFNACDRALRTSELGGLGGMGWGGRWKEGFRMEDTCTPIY